MQVTTYSCTPPYGGDLVPPGLLAGTEVGLRPGGEEDTVILELGVGQSQGLHTNSIALNDRCITANSRHAFRGTAKMKAGIPETIVLFMAVFALTPQSWVCKLTQSADIFGKQRQ